MRHGLRGTGRKFTLVGSVLVVFFIIYKLAGGSLGSPNMNGVSVNQIFNKDNSRVYDECLLLHKLGSISDMEKAFRIWDSHDVCRDLHQKFSAIFRLSSSKSHIRVEQPFLSKVKRWLPGRYSKEQIENQEIMSLFNKYTYEHSIINLVRSKRPGVSSTDDVETYIKNLVQESAKNCDFCQYHTNTAKHTFGRIVSKYAVSAANVFPFDGYHGLIIPRTHHPLKFSEEEFLDVMDVATRWMIKGHEETPSYRFPHLTWDCLPKGSASQVHTHAQVTLNSQAHYGQMELLKSAASRYEKEFVGESYFQTLLQIHQNLNLSICLGNARAYANLTPKKDNDMFFIALEPSEEYFKLLYLVLRAFIDEMKIYAWSLVTFFPALVSFKDSDGSWDHKSIPVITRLINRGPPTLLRADISSLELFAASNVNVDPYKTIAGVRRFLQSSGIDSKC
ncbi:hypothetical protein HOLleu_05513 [Holothuria leucospilota]|uniref:Galactose-1-phosphate uridylyltransferase n=1 Tax=Holothuria leucospilota TaxID=206669 RepID=A0A9Q1HEK4_HOLLE|nr:hypothetical protein HOLleu_05513 [Holothuria leucospilota]